MHAPSYGAAYAIYVPSLFAAMGVFSGMFAGFTLLAAIHQGVITRCRVTPISRVSLLLGRVGMYVLLVAFQGVVVTVIAVAFGLRVNPGDFLYALVLLSLMVVLSVSLGYDLALLVPSENALGNLINSLAQPLSLLAGVPYPALARTALGTARRLTGTRSPGGPTACGRSCKAASAPTLSGKRPSSWPWWPW